MLLPDEWRQLEAATGSGFQRYRMTGQERLLLYQTALHLGLRSDELRNLTRVRLYFDATPPNIVCKAGSTKNGKDARQYIQPELAADLLAHSTSKAPVFNLPHESNLARVLRNDLAKARKSWLKEAANDPGEYARREQSDFLLDTNHEGKITDFHSLRHTCGAWLAMAGVHPKVVQQVMRHQSIILTMDTYGHLFSGQEVHAVHFLRDMLVGSPTALRATGTDEAMANTQLTHSARRSACDAKRGKVLRWSATARSSAPRNKNRPSH